MQLHTMLGRVLCGAALTVSAIACDVDDSELGRPGTPDSRPGDESDRIVGGSNTNITAVPWQVSIQTSGGFHFCGGSIIDEEWILTAAHCMTSNNGSPNSTGDMRIKAGVTNKNGSGQLRSIAKLVVVPGYNGDTTKGKDVALLQLDSPLDLSGNTASAIELADEGDSDHYKAGIDGLVSGWGTLSSGGSSPITLQSVQVPIITHAQAEQAYGNLTSDQIGAGKLGVGGVDSCQGDSGGPFVVSSPGGSLLVGVVSWGSGCAGANAPGMYARVPSFISWIDEVTGGVGGGGGDGGGDDGGDGGDGGGDPGPNSCIGRCGEFTQGLACQCDDKCTDFNDCCADLAPACDGGGDGGGDDGDVGPLPGPDSCVDACGGKSSSCWCDDQCEKFGDCCDNISLACG